MWLRKTQKGVRMCNVGAHVCCCACLPSSPTFSVNHVVRHKPTSCVMPPAKKGGKSSASSATRKKQAAKAAKKAGQDPAAAVASAEQAQGSSSNGQQPQQSAQRGQKKDKKLSKKEQKSKKKVYIPPPKPPQAPPDPLDTLGLASLLPPGLVVLLRKAAKKDVITRQRALEGLLSWCNGQDEDGESRHMSEDERNSALVMMLPSWVSTSLESRKA